MPNLVYPSLPRSRTFKSDDGSLVYCIVSHRVGAYSGPVWPGVVLADAEWMVVDFPFFLVLRCLVWPCLAGSGWRAFPIALVFGPGRLMV